ncbi:MAG: putative oxidoreductase [Candidatus Eremiobacteraeota bacterium]|nr:putative oxidoreductase [Candidatus Eremiobacteraeota bacterium]
MTSTISKRKSKTTLPKTMRAAVLDAPGPPEAFRIAEVPVPPLKRKHVIIALHFAGVGSWDAKERTGEWRTIEPGTILGSDGSGTIAAVGAGVEDLHVGDRVYSYSYQNPEGGYYAQYVSVLAERVARVPAQIRDDVAGAMPCVALTAQAGLDALHVKHDQTVLVFGASGGVGSLAVFLASVRKAKVVAASRSDTHKYVQRLGAAIAVDPNAPDLDEHLDHDVPNGIDAALLTASGDALPRFFPHLRKGAPVAYPDGVEPEPVVPRHQMIVFSGEMTRRAFDELDTAIGDRTIPLEVTVYPLDDVVAAHRRLDQGHVVGKLALRIR